MRQFVAQVVAHRPGEPVQVVFMAYRNTLQADALKLVAQKLQGSLAVEGELARGRPRLLGPQVSGAQRRICSTFAAPRAVDRVVS